MSSHFLHRIFLFYHLSICSILLVSCGFSRKSSPTSPDPSNVNPAVVANTLQVGIPKFDFSSTYEGVGSQFVDITFVPNTDKVTNFTVDIDEASKQNNDWTIIKSDACTSTLSTGNVCKITIKFAPAPKQTRVYNTFLLYSYTNSISASFNNKIPLLNKSIKSLLDTPITAKIKEKQLNSSELFTGMFFIGVRKDKSERNELMMYDFTGAEFLIDFNVEAYGLASTLNTIFYVNRLKKNILYSLTTRTGVFLQDDLQKMYVGKNNIYGINDVGNIYSINSAGTSNLITNVGINRVDLLFVDKTSNDRYIYGIFHNDVQYPYIVCEIDTINKTSICTPIDNNFHFENAVKLVAENGKIFVLTYSPDNQQSYVYGLKSDHKALTPFFATTGINVDNLLIKNNYDLLTYDEKNNVLYFGAGFNNIYSLYAVDASDKSIGQFSSQDLGEQSSMKFSRPFLTASNVGNSRKVLVVSSNGIFAFQTDTAASSIKLNKFLFNDGGNFYSLPLTASAKIYPLLASIYNGSIFIPTVAGNLQTNYLFKINW